MMRREVFVDAGAWVAIGDVSDQYHQAAAAYHRLLMSERRALVTTNLVIAESYSLILRGAGQRVALRFLASLRQSSRVVRIYSTSDIEAQAEEILARYSDHDFSLVDAVSFAVMRQRGMGEAFAFDRHFRAAGFDLVPGASPA